MRKRSPEVADSALAAAARVLAAELDNSGNSATAKSMCARALAEAMEKLTAMLPPAETKDGLDELNAAREKRRSKRTG